MEEAVGGLWHRLITRAAAGEHPAAAASFAALRGLLGPWYRALGGPAGRAIEATGPRPWRAHRSLLQRLAGSHRRFALAWQDADALRLPDRLAPFPDPASNRRLYLWLAALAAVDPEPVRDPLGDNVERTRRLLARCPGLQADYRRLAAAALTLRPRSEALPPALREAEARLRTALATLRVPPGPPIDGLPPVPLWLYPPPGKPATSRPATADDETGGEPARRTAAERKRRAAEYSDAKQDKGGLIAFRLESLFTLSEFVDLDRCHDDGEDPHAARAADDLDVLSLARRSDARPAAALRFDLDLPAPRYDDRVLDDGLRLPEWDHRRRCLLPDHCRLLTMVARETGDTALPGHLRAAAARLRRRFAALRPQRGWRRREADGEEIDLDAWLEHRTAAGSKPAEPRVYRRLGGRERDLAALLLADLSLSTEAALDEGRSVIDVIRDALYLFAEAVGALGDPFALWGFSSRRRDHVRFHLIKTFEEPYGAAVRGRIAALRPGFYTRMGAPIRRATQLLAARPAARRVLLLLSDGKPNDLDHYEGRWGIEDTRQALREARRAGIRPFCLTIDQEGNDYLPYLFGHDGYVLLHQPAALPAALARLYLQLTF
ncbi:MAG: hypothetical protein KatS3mg121_0804 [Gammaproteobacteria bacterium]|nr:MAG: hypothetical protein KatS3mg121_0804 [Gammaproteobacteria bacterium]